MDKLIKFCKPEHNILDRCRTIRFGTLEYYRDLDSSFMISDTSEGMETTLVKSLDKPTASAEALASLGAIANAKTIRIRDGRIQTIFPNCYIWCCSRLHEPVTPNQGTQYDQDYTSCYEITDVRQFSNQLGRILLNNITRTAFRKDARKKIDAFSIAEMNELSIQMVQKDVVYVDEKISSIEEGKLSSYFPDIPHPYRQLFVKHKEYEKDQEYRIVFIIQHPNHGYFAVQQDPVDLPIISINCIEQIAQPT